MLRQRTVQPALEKGSRIAVIDGHAVAFYSWFSNYSTTVSNGMLNKLLDILEEYAPSHLIITFDPPPPTFRHELYPPYKGNRPPVPQEFLAQCDDLFETLNRLNIPFYQVPKYEADDLIGTVASQTSEYGVDTLIFTSDLDLLQLVDSLVEVEVFSQYGPRRLFDENAAIQRFGGISPKYIPDFKGLAGDPSDNLPGVKGIGKIAATAILRAKLNLEGVYDDLDSISELPIRGAKRVTGLLRDNECEAFKMRGLATVVKDVPMDIDWSASCSNGIKERLKSWN